jgi:hypothetical protein
MNDSILPAHVRAELEALQLTLDEMRKSRGVSRRDELLTHYPDDDDWIIAEADGLGSAKLMVVAGNYPFDYNVNHQHYFDIEEDACTAAEWLDWKLRTSGISRDDFFDQLKEGKRPWEDDPYDEEADNGA